MKEILTKIKGTKAYQIIATFLVVDLLGKLTFAQDASTNPFDSGGLLPDSMKDKDVLSTSMTLFGYGLKLIAVASIGMGIGFVLFGLYKSYQEARDRGSWDNVTPTIVWSIVIVTVSVVFGSLAWLWSESILNLVK